MKYIIILGDGMSDEPIESLGGKTPLEYANTPCLDSLSKRSKVGLATTIPRGMNPGSDTANLSVLGYNPRKYYTGRSPLEALSIGVNMVEGDIGIRCNLVTVSDDELPYAEKVMIDHSSNEISTEDAAVLINAVKEKLENEFFKFYTGTSYRHCTIWKHGTVIDMTPPHDILGKMIGEYLPKEDALRKMMEESYSILNRHPVNIQRVKEGLNKANSIWFWGAGTKPSLLPFAQKFGKKGAMISAVDLLKGIALGADMTNIEVEGANGTLHTNYEGKALAAVKAVTEDGFDFVYVHVEAPDEMGHQGSVERKIQAIEFLDTRVISLVVEKMNECGEEYRLLVMPDHPTPLCTRTHSSEPVPYLLYDSAKLENNKWNYNEKEALASGNLLSDGYLLINELFDSNVLKVY